MANDSKLLGVLELDSKNVQSTIKEVNDALKSLGQGVDLNLTNILNAKVGSQLKQIQDQIAGIGKATKEVGSSDGTTSIQNRINEMVGLGKAVKSAKDSYEAFDKAELKMMANLQKQQEKYMQQQAKLDSKATIDSINRRAKEEEKAMKAAEENARKMQQYHDQQKNYGVNLVGAASLAILKKQWTEAVNYATSYYEALNEIRVVTEMSEQAAMKMGQNMRDLAEEMKVTSTELSEAAITFYRQGLDDAEVQDRLKWVTEYAKVAHIGFEDAAELMTAAINTMGDSIEQSGIENVVEHIADVWLYLGDHAATSGEEIGKAMQKASASATEFGMSFEWLGTYIAVVSEQTRQAPEAIGNAFNSMMARMHQIKATGFNNEDTTKLNDVAKALATINVELTENGQWRAMSDIYSDIAKKWGEMDAKQRGYIATTMAGTRQQNVFYALMNDMSKGLENGSRAWELYEGAMDAAGTATKKYAIYQESIEATQADMTNSLEQLYSNLQPTLIKGFYELITLIVDGLNNLGGVFPVVSAGIAGLATAFIAFHAAASPFVIVLSAAAAALGTLFVGGAMGALLGGGETAVEKYKKITDEIADSNKKITSLQTAEADIGTMLAKVQSGATLSTEELKKYSNSLKTISSISPTAEQGVRNLTKGFGDQTTILQELSDKTQEAIDKQLSLKKIQAETALINFSNTEEYMDAGEYSRSRYDRKARREIITNDPREVWTVINSIPKLQNYINGLVDAGSFARYDRKELVAAIDNFYAEYESVVSEATKEQAQKVMDNITDSLGENVSGAQRNYLGEKILDMLMGPDGKLDYEDVAADRIHKIWGQLQKGAEEAFSNTSQYKNWLLENLSEYFGISAEDISESLIMESDGKIEEATIGIIEQMYDLVTAGGDVNAIFEALSTSSSWDEFTIKLDGVKKSVQETNKALDEGGGGEDEDPLKNIKTAYTEIDKIQSLLDKMKDGKPVKLKDLIEMAESHPEILAVADDLEKLKAKLEEIQELSKGDIKTALTDMILGTNLEDSSFSPLNQEASRIQAENGVKTVGEYRNYLAGQEGTEGVVANIDATIASQVDGLISASEETTELTDDFSDFLEQVNNLNNAKDALKVFQDLANGELVETSKIENAAKALKELFPDKNLDPSSATFIEDVTAAITELTAETEGGASAFGILGQTIIDSMTRGVDAVDKFKYATADIVNSVANSGNREAIGAYMENIFGGYGNVDWRNRQRISPERMAELGWDIGESSYATKFGSLMTPHVGDKQYAILVTPILENGDVLTPEALDTYVDDVSQRASELGLSLLEADAVENGGQGLIYYTDEINNNFDEAVAKAEEFEGALSALQAAYYASAIVEYGQTAADGMSEAREQLDGYKDALDKLNEAYQSGYIDNVIVAFTALSDSTQSGIATNYKKLTAALGDAAKAISQYEAASSRAKKAEQRREGLDEESAEWQELTRQIDAASAEMEVASKDIEKAEKRVGEALKEATTLNSAKYFKKTAEELKELSSSGGDYTDVLKTFTEEEKTAIAAQEEYNKIVEEGGVTAQTTVEDVSNLSEALGWDAQSILKNWERIGPLMEQLGMDMEAVRASLQKEIFFSLVGTSTADFSAIQEGLMSVENMAQSTIDTLIATGQFEVIRKWMEEGMEYQTFDPEGNIITTTAKTSGFVDVIVPKGGSVPTKPSGSGSGSGGGGGGGGGGSKETKPISESTRALDRMSKIQDLQNHTQSLYSAQAGYYEQTGEIDLAIKYHQKEIEVIQRKNATLEDNIEELEDLIEKKREEVSSLDKSSEEYETATKELEDLQKRHQEYTLAVIENKTQIDSLVTTIKEMKKEVRDMQIELYDEVVAALEARDEAEKERLEGTINVQNAILEVMEEQDDALSKQHDMENARVSLEQELLSTMEEQEEVANRMLDGRIAMENNVLSILEAQDEKKKNQEEKEKGILDASVQLENEILNVIQQQESTKQSMREGQISMENTILGIMKDQKSTADAMLDSRISVENLVLETLKMQEDIQNRLLEGRISMESTILGILQQQEKANLQILDGRIGVENSILNILKQQDSLTSQMLSSRIGMENTILNIIKAQVSAEKSQVSAVVNVENAVANMIKAQIDAEKNMMKARSNMEGILTGFIKTDIQERANAAAEAAEAANEANQKQIEALHAQKDLLDEQLRLRKEAAQTQDKQAKLAELEAQYARISADPTRMKEALKIRKQIDELRDEMAWDIAEKEVEAQKKAIDKKIEALSAKQTPTGGTVTYDMQEINTTVEGILDTMSDEEIINWLKEHSADYKDASKIGKELLVQEWQAALDEMHGVSESYLDEVSDVLKMSDDEILAWFKDNSEEYQQASDARKSQMEDEWKEMLANMHGETETYVEQVAELLDKPREEILQWLMENDKNYLNASEDSKTKMLNDWNDALDKMYGVTKSYQDRVTELIGMSREELLEWFKENDQNYLNASEDSQKKMVNDWNSALDKMYGVTKDYREEIASIMKMSRDELLGWLMESDSNYLMATEDNQQKMVKSWNDTLDKMFGATDNYRAQVSAIMSMDDEEILSWLMGNNTNYLNATSDSSKTKLEKEWRDMLSNMRGETESYVEAVALVLEGSRSEIIDWLMSNDASYMIASEEQKNKMIDDWNDALDKMYGVTKDYRDQVSYVMSMDEEGILGWLMTNNDSYLRASDASQRQMVQQWKDTLSNMHDDTKSYVQAVADILGQPREEILQWMIENDTEYEKASDAQRSKMVKDWESALDDMYGTTTNHWTKITEVMNSGLEGFLEYMETNSTSYANMSDTEKSYTVKEWTDTWREMVDETVDHREEVQAVMEQGYDYFISYMKENSEAYKTATDEAKQSMVDSWKDMWDQMEGTTKSYEEEANSIIAAGQDAILKTLGTYVKDYQKYGKLQSEAYLDEWEDKIEKLKKALKVVGDIEDKSYDYTVTDLKDDAPTGTKDSGSSGSKSGEDSGVKWWRVSVNKSRGFETKAEAEAFKSERIASIQAELAKNPSDKDLQNRLNTWNNASISYYLHGGMVNKTGPIWVDGTPELPERILSPRQTELFEILVESMDEMSKMYVPSIPSFGNVMTDNRNGSFSFGDIIVNVEHLDSDTDYDEMAEHVLDSVMGKINRSSVVGGIRFSK